MALRDLGVPFEKYRVVEWDKYAIKSYNAIHETEFETTDITKIHANDLGIVDVDKYEYLMFYSFPCTDLSVAGKQAGMKEGSGTSSALLWEVRRLIDEMTELPRILCMENVPQVHSKKNIDQFQQWLDFLESKGYKNYYQDLNAKNFGIPQSRNRCFCVSLLGDYEFEFPEPIELRTTVRDYLENQVDEKYYLKSEKAKILIDKLVEGGKIPIEKERVVTELCLKNPRVIDTANCIKARYDMGISNLGSDGTGVCEYYELL